MNELLEANYPKRSMSTCDDYVPVKKKTTTVTPLILTTCPTKEQVELCGIDWLVRFRPPGKNRFYESYHVFLSDFVSNRVNVFNADPSRLDRFATGLIPGSPTPDMIWVAFPKEVK